MFYTNLERIRVDSLNQEAVEVSRHATNSATAPAFHLNEQECDPIIHCEL